MAEQLPQEKTRASVTFQKEKALYDNNIAKKKSDEIIKSHSQLSVHTLDEESIHSTHSFRIAENKECAVNKEKRKSVIQDMIDDHMYDDQFSEREFYESKPSIASYKERVRETKMKKLKREVSNSKIFEIICCGCLKNAGGTL